LSNQTTKSTPFDASLTKPPKSRQANMTRLVVSPLILFSGDRLTTVVSWAGWRMLQAPLRCFKQR